MYQGAGAAWQSVLQITVLPSPKPCLDQHRLPPAATLLLTTLPSHLRLALALDDFLVLRMPCSCHLCLISPCAQNLESRIEPPVGCCRSITYYIAI